MGRQDLKNIRKWVRVERNGTLHRFETFDEALSSKVGGHLMTQEYFDHHYSVKDY